VDLASGETRLVPGEQVDAEVRRILASVDIESPAATGSQPVIEDAADPDVETAWADEIVRRVERIERGEATGTPVEEVRARMLARFGHR
jgi:hypothetical protein